MFLTTEEEQSFQGEHGEAIQLAMSVLVKLGEMYNADRMIRIENVHVDASSYYGISDAGVEFVEKMVEVGAAYKVPTTLCIASIDFENHAEFEVSDECVEKQLRIARAHSTMGANPTWTCTPYQCGSLVKFGQNIAWGESNAIAFVNSVIGARTIRCADFVDICAAVTGLMPRFGLYLDDQRRGSVLFKLEDLDTRQFTSADYAASIDCLHIKMKKDGAHGYITAKIYSDSGGVPGTLLATSQLKASDNLPTEFAWEIFYFSTPAQISPSTDYWVVIDTSSVSVGTVYVRVSGVEASAKHAYYSGTWYTEDNKQILHRIRGSFQAHRVAEDIVRFYKDPHERIRITAPAVPQLQLLDEVLVDITLRGIRGRYVIEGRRHIITPDKYTTIDTLRKVY